MIAPKVCCPRCAYDVSGPVAGWTESCPIRGQCPECGLTFRWAHVFNADSWRLEGFVEHAKGLRQFVGWTLRTWGWALLPWRFWSRVELHHRPRPWVMLGWLLFIAGVCRVSTAVLQYINASFSGYVPFRDWSFFSPLTLPVVNLSGPLARLPRVDPMWGSWPTGACWLLASVILFPILLALMPISMRRATIRPVHVLRASIFSFAWPVLYVVQDTVFDLGTFAFWQLRPPGSAPSIWTYYQTIESVRLWVFDAVVMGGLVWGLLWWLLTLVKGWKLRHGVLAWFLLMVVLACVCTGLFGFEFTIHGHTYRF